VTTDGDDRLRLDYDQTTQLLRMLTDIRFKLIAFVPTIAAASVGLFGKPRPAVELLAIGLLGLTATVGILVYELRNSQIYAAAAKRAADLEAQLGFQGGLYSDHPPRRCGFSGCFRQRVWPASGSSTASRLPGGATSSRGDCCTRSASAVRDPSA
jgi:hypothetical protein